MDYSASIHETEDPAASPWGNAPVSPRPHEQTTFGEAGGVSPSSSFPYSQHADQDGFQRPGTATTESGTEGGDVDHSTTLGSSIAESADDSHQGASQQASEHHSQPAPDSHRQVQQQQQPPPQPKSNWRLQAKITGLERTGKKDPVLRFDVHVCSSNIPLLMWSIDVP